MMDDQRKQFHPKSLLILNSEELIDCNSQQPINASF